MLTFEHPPCEHPKCVLRESARNPLIPTRQWPEPMEPAFKRACVLIGEAPGDMEDAKRESWVGPAGKLLTGFLKISGLVEHCDLYLSNACRCRPPMNKRTPTHSQINYCKRYLYADLLKIRKQYREVILFLQGASACHAILGAPLNQSFFQQNTPIEIALEPGDRSRFRVFLTHHPAALLPMGKRKPQLIDSTSLHWDLVKRYITGTSVVPQILFQYEMGTFPGKEYSHD